MPWAEIGRYQFDLAQVVLVTRGVDDESNSKSVTISLKNGREIELSGEDARVFLIVFAKFTESRPFGKPPPTIRRIFVGESGSGRRPVDPRCVEGPSLLPAHDPVDANQA